MEELIEQLRNKYYNSIATIKTAGKAEITVTIAKETDATNFSQELQDHLIENIDKLSIVKINIVDCQGFLIDSFATNQ